MLHNNVELLTTAQVARRLRQSEEVVRRKARDGTLPAVRLGYGPRAPLRFDARELEAFIFGDPAAGFPSASYPLSESPAERGDPSGTVDSPAHTGPEETA
jgi:excisionase family DNA binding protein